MMRRILLAVGVCLSLCTSASAQQRPIFDPDDFVDPRQHPSALFISSVVAGGGTDVVNDYRPLHRGAGFLLVTNSIYWKNLEVDYKYSKVLGVDEHVQLQRCGCAGVPIDFPTPPSNDATPLAPPAAPKETLQFGWYYSVHGRTTEPPVKLRLRITGSWQPVDSVVRSFRTGDVIERHSGYEKSLGIETDTYLRLGRHDVWGALLYAKTMRAGTLNRSQSEFLYTSRFPAWARGPLLIRATFTVGIVSGRGASGPNVANPAFEAFWHLRSSHANVHLIWSPLSTRSGTGGWESHQQIALFVGHPLYAHLFGPGPPPSSNTEH
jgi:hypothetical protein